MDEEKRSITLVTYNLDCKGIYQEDRFDTFINQMKEIDPDVIAIQEGNKSVYSKLFLMMKRMGYKFEQYPEIHRRKCSEMIFSKLPIVSHEFQRFRSTEQDRGLTIYRLDVFGKEICIVTTQLECGVRRVPFLRKQIEDIDKLSSKINSPIILLGDLQISSFQIDIKQPKYWFDSWEEAGTSKEKYSIDYKTNILADVQDRPDRIWFLPRDILECDDCRLVGLPLPRHENFFASKHFGVLARFFVN